MMSFGNLNKNISWGFSGIKASFGIDFFLEGCNCFQN
jgi:hypothetical protein